MKSLLLEICVETLADSIAAREGGADRLELCARLDLEGLTPALDLVQAVKAAVALPVMAMVRPRGGDFDYTPDELAAMRASIKPLIAAGADGLVFGVLRPGRSIDRDACARLVQECAGRPVVFHRAFDLVADRTAALEQLIDLGFRRVLTSGGGARAAEPQCISELRRQIAQARGRIEIMPGGGIRPDNIALIVRETGCTQIHSSARPRVEPRTSPERVAALRAALAAPL